MTGNSTGLEIPNLSFGGAQLRWETAFSWASSKTDYVGCTSVKNEIWENKASANLFLHGINEISNCKLDLSDCRLIHCSLLKVVNYHFWWEKNEKEYVNPDKLQIWIILSVTDPRNYQLCSIKDTSLI